MVNGTFSTSSSLSLALFCDWLPSKTDCWVGLIHKYQIKLSYGGSILQIANILFVSIFLPIPNLNISKWPHRRRPPPAAMMAYCLWSRVLCTISGPRISFSLFCILGGLKFGGNCGTFSKNLSLGRSTNSTSTKLIYVE